MGYLREFQTQLANRDLTKFLKLWEEYCTCDAADAEEIKQLLTLVKGSDFAKSFGSYVEMFLPLWETLDSKEDSYAVLSLIMDLQTTNSPKLRELALEALTAKYGAFSPQDRESQEQLRLVGLRSKEDFQSALSHYDLLAHMQVGNFVFHLSGFGAGEVMDRSSLRELVTVEFENVSGLKQITFANALKSLAPLASSHFLARRFSDADAFEQEARNNPVEIVKLLLKDLGPKTAMEIKDELSELVIPEKDWQKWWANARTKLKKDTEIEFPESQKDPFSLRTEAISHEQQFLESIRKNQPFSEFLAACYAFSRDYSAKLKIESVKQEVVSRLKEYLQSGKLKAAEILQVYFSLETIEGVKYETEIATILRQQDSLNALIEQIDIIVYKRLALAAVKTHLENWPQNFFALLQTCSQGIIRDYLIKELIQNGYRKLLENGLQELVEQPWENPDLFVWYYTKLMHEPEEGLPFHTAKGRDDFSEALLVLLNRIENDSGYKDLVKKIYTMFSLKRYALVRQIFEGSSYEFAKEFLLLASKCHTLTDHDLKIWRSLAEVPHPSLGESASKKKETHAHHIIWTTEENLRAQTERLKKIATSDVVENAKEIEAARALGDLRENSEYKSALEKRSFLQGEIKKLSQELSAARILTPADISEGEVGVGSRIRAEDNDGHAVIFTIMGPWEANPDAHILSFQSKIAQSMMGLGCGDQFKFKEIEYTIKELGSIFSEG